MMLFKLLFTIMMVSNSSIIITIIVLVQAEVFILELNTTSVGEADGMQVCPSIAGRPNVILDEELVLALMTRDGTGIIYAI